MPIDNSTKTFTKNTNKLVIIEWNNMDQKTAKIKLFHRLLIQQIVQQSN